MAAGLGTRFGHYTELVPKGFVEVGGKPMIIRSIETLLSCGIERIILGTGYKKEAYEALQADFPQIETCFSPRYADTNSMYTLYNTRDVIGDDNFLLLESDLVFERKAILSLLDDEFPDVMGVFHCFSGSLEMAKQLTAEERETLKKKVKTHRDRLRRIVESEGEREQFIRAIRKFMEMRTLTNQILRELIDHIDVYEVEGRGKNRTQRMVIYYKFVGYLEIPSHLSAPNYKADLRQGVAVEYVSCEPTECARELFDEECEPEE